MLNARMPDVSELPTTRQLLGATAFALFGSLAILITIVMPSEYGTDPTGVGRVLGLTQMGEIKTELAASAAADRAAAAIGPATEQPAIAAAPADGAAATRTDRVEVTLAPGEAAEIKVTASADAAINFSWTVNGGRVNFDMHGDPVRRVPGFYHGYGRGRASAGERGTLVAAFDGTHGWFWRNRSDRTVTVILQTDGAYSAIRRVV